MRTPRPRDRHRVRDRLVGLVPRELAALVARGRAGKPGGDGARREAARADGSFREMSALAIKLGWWLLVVAFLVAVLAFVLARG